MSRPNLYLVPINRISVEETQFITLVKFLQSNPDRLLRKEEQDSIFSSRALVNTPIGKLFGQAQSSGALDAVQLVVNPSTRDAGGREHIPVALSYRHLCLDMTQIAEAFPRIAPAINVLPALSGKLVLNATPYLSRGLHGFIQRDTDTLHSMVIRDLLCRSYDQARTAPSWLEGDILLTAAHVYGALTATALARGFDVSREVQHYMQMCATLYFLSMVQTPNIALSTIQGKARKFFLPSGAEMTSMLERLEGIIKKPVPETLDEMINAINGLEIPRLVVNRRVLRDVLRSVAPDPTSSAIAVEYPPYFIWSLLLTLIGSPSYLSIFIKKQKMNRDVAQMAELLLRSHLFLPELGRG